MDKSVYNRLQNTPTPQNAMVRQSHHKDLPPDFLLDEVIEKNRKRQEELRLRVIEKILMAIDKLSEEIAFKEAYLFGSVTKPFRFSERSDIDIGFIGLDNRHFFKVMSYISEEAGRDVDIVQLEDHRLAAKIKKGVSGGEGKISCSIYPTDVNVFLNSFEPPICG